MIKISGTQEEIDNFIEALLCPVDDNIGTLNKCPLDGTIFKDCNKCVLNTYSLELIYED